MDECQGFQDDEPIENTVIQFNDFTFNETNDFSISSDDPSTAPSRSELTLDLLKDDALIDSFTDTNQQLEKHVRKYRTLKEQQKALSLRLNKVKFVTESLIEVCYTPGRLPDSLAAKCRRIIRLARLRKTCGEFCRQTGVPTPDVHLTDDELGMEQKQLRTELENRCDTLKSRFEKHSSSLDIIDMLVPKSLLTEGKACIVQTVKELCDTLEAVDFNTRRTVSIFEEMHEQRIDEDQIQQIQELDDVENKTKLLEFKLFEMSKKLECIILEQDQDVKSAVEKLYDELRNTADQMEYSLLKLKKKKEEYDSLAGTRFDDIVEEYRNLRDSFEHKSWALGHVKPTLR